MNGDKLGACNVAISEKLWPHALILSAQIDKETYQRVVTEYVANSIYNSNNDALTDSESIASGTKYLILKAMYKIFSGMKVAALSEIEADHNRWNELLYSILANRTTEDLGIISSMGDFIQSRGLLTGSHVWSVYFLFYFFNLSLLCLIS
jgi:hypothetical protein